MSSSIDRLRGIVARSALLAWGGISAVCLIAAAYR